MRDFSFCVLNPVKNNLLIECMVDLDNVKNSNIILTFPRQCGIMIGAKQKLIKRPSAPIDC